jgi:hypothetical protein
MFIYEIKSTIDAKDSQETINVGDSLYTVDRPDSFGTKDQAYEAGLDVLNGLDGGRAYNKALETAEIQVFLTFFGILNSCPD